MAKTREIRRRIKAVGNIARITKTMQMIATARFQAASKRASAAKPYSRKIGELVGELSSTAANADHPLLHPPGEPAGRRLLLVITSNRGLCGGYNANLLRTAAQWLRDRQAAEPTGEVVLEVVGKKGMAYFKFTKRAVSKHHTQFGDLPRYEPVYELADRYMQEFTAGRYDSVSVVYMSFESMSRQRPVVTQLLPMRPPSAAAGRASGPEGPGLGIGHPGVGVEYEFSPSAEKLLSELLPETVKVTLFQCFNEATVGEQIARMVAMKSATDAAKKMGKHLSRKYNRARQAAITTELMEVIAGSAALE